MSREKLFGVIGLGLFFLFPLISLLQLRDTDEAWRVVAGRARASVVLVNTGDASHPVGCAVVLQRKPARAVMAGVPATTPIASVTPSGTIAWRALWIDPKGEFTVLESEGALDTAASDSQRASQDAMFSSLVPLDAVALRDVASTEESTEPVAAVLVSPSPLRSTSLWVGTLQADRTVDGHTIYHGAQLRALRDPTGLATAAADVSGKPALIDPVLAGAPFVTREGLALALYLGDRQGAPSAVPMARIRDAIASLDRHAAQ